MNIVRLGDVCKVISGSTPKREISEYWDGDIPWVTPKEISRLSSPFLWDSAEKITDAGFRSCSTSILPVNSLLLSSRAPIGLLAINKIPVCTNQGFKSLIPSKEVNVEYLYYVLKANVASLQSRGNGATFKELAKPAVEEFEIPLPPLDDQIRIAHLLGKVESLIAQRKQHLQQLDDLLKSVFLDMFGDPTRNEKGWDKQAIGSFASVRTGSTPNRQVTEYYGGSIPWVKTTEVQNCDIFSTEERITELALRETSCSLYPAGTILLAMYGQGRTRGQVGYLRIQAATNQACAAILPSKHNQSFIFNQLRFLYSSIRALGRGGNQENLNLSLVKSIEILLPPEDIQNQFATIVVKIEDVKSLYQQSLANLKALYDALSQKAFKGELDLSRVPMPNIQPFEGESVAAESAHTRVEKRLTINLPDTGNLLDALDSTEARKHLIALWLESYQRQIGDTPFSVQHFMATAQARLAELHPDDDFELGAEDYEHIKAWVFEALAAGTLTQTFDDTSNSIQLKAQQA